jgi:hypothetical protein
MNMCSRAMDSFMPEIPAEGNPEYRERKETRYVPPCMRAYRGSERLVGMRKDLLECGPV